jgi:hypothetical protein
MTRRVVKKKTWGSHDRASNRAQRERRGETVGFEPIEMSGGRRPKKNRSAFRHLKENWRCRVTDLNGSSYRKR